MRIAHVADIHISEVRIEEFKLLMEKLATKIVGLNPDVVVFAGDMFINRDRLTPNQVEVARKFFKEYLKDIPTIVIPGNHDCTQSENKVDSLSAIFTNDDIVVQTKISAYQDIGGTRFHMFSYPTKAEIVRWGLSDVGQVVSCQKIFDSFQFDKSKKNILVFHGVLEGASINPASESQISVGKEVVIPKSFWGKFDAVMAGHIHSYQTLDNALYPGCPFPLTYADDGETGFVLWDNMQPEFIPVEQPYPYITYNLGMLDTLHDLSTKIRDNIVFRDSYKDCRVRVKYSIPDSRSGEIDHTKISKYFHEAKEIKIVPSYVSSKRVIVDDLDSFNHKDMFELISKYIDAHKYSPVVKVIAKNVEDKVSEKYSANEGRGIHFRITKFAFSNFKCFSEVNEPINLEELNQVIGVFGPNKAGKSALMEVISWGLYGETIRNKDVKSVIRNGESKAWVDVEFVSYDTKYRIYRERGKESRLNLYNFIGDRWVDISSNTATATQKAIEKIVGSFDIFLATVYSPQNKIDILVQKKPSDRKQIILDCLQVDLLTHRQTEISELKKDYKSKYDQLKGKIEVLSDQVQKLISGRPAEMIRQYEQGLDVLKIELTRLNAHLISFQSKVTEYDSYNAEYKEVAGSIAELETKLRELKTKIDEKEREKEKYLKYASDRQLITDGIKNLANARQQLDTYSEENKRNVERKNVIAGLVRAISVFEKDTEDQIARLNSSGNNILLTIKNLEKIDCSNSDCPINKKINSEISSQRIKLDELSISIEEIRQTSLTRMAELKEQRLSVEKELENSFYSPDKYMEAMRFLRKEEEHRWEDLKAKVESNDDFLSQMSELIGAYIEKETELAAKIRSLKDRRTDLASKLSSIEKYRKEIEVTSVEIGKATRKIDDYKLNITRCQSDIVQINQTQEEVIKISKEVEDVDVYLSACNKYSEIVGKSGVLYGMIDKAIPIIEKFSQDLLSTTTNGLISITMESFKTLSSGDRSDDVMIYLSDAKGKRDVLEASGAESFLVSLALRAAMANLMSIRMGSKVELFVIDEGLGALDENSIAIAKQMFREIGNKFSKVLFITHIPEMKEVAQSVIKVDTNGLISTVEVIKEIS